MVSVNLSFLHTTHAHAAAVTHAQRNAQLNCDFRLNLVELSSKVRVRCALRVTRPEFNFYYSETIKKAQRSKHAWLVDLYL